MCFLTVAHMCFLTTIEVVDVLFGQGHELHFPSLLVCYTGSMKERADIIAHHPKKLYLYYFRN